MVPRWKILLGVLALIVMPLANAPISLAVGDSPPPAFVDACTYQAQNPTYPCVISLRVNGSPDTSQVMYYSGPTPSYQVWAQDATTTDATVTLQIDLGDATTTTTNFMMMSAGHAQSLTVGPTSTPGGLHRVIEATTTSAEMSWLAPGCDYGNCGDEQYPLTANTTFIGAAIVLLPVGGSDHYPASASGVRISTNAQSYGYAFGEEEFSFELAAPHFKVGGAAVNSGYFEVYLPIAALTDIFNLDDTVNAENFLDLMGVKDALTDTDISGVVVENVLDQSDPQTSFLTGLKISANITYSSHDVTIAPLPESAPPQSSGNDSSGAESSETRQTPASTTTTAPSTSPMEQPVIAQIPARNPEVSYVAAPGIAVLSRAEAGQVADRVMRNPSSSAMGDAPRVRSQLGQPIALVVPSQTPSTAVSVQIKVDGKYVDLGTVTTDASGNLALPAFKPTKPGRYTIAIVDPVTGKTSYVKVVVPRKPR